MVPVGQPYSLAQAVDRYDTDDAFKLLASGQQKYERSDLAGARSDWEKALIFFEGKGLKPQLGQAYEQLSKVYAMLGDYPLATDFAQKSLSLALETADGRTEGRAYNSLGNIYRYRGDYDRALEYLTRALKLAREHRDRPAEELALNNIGGTYYALGDKPKAIGYYEQTLKIALDLQDKFIERIAANNLAQCHLNLGNLTAARDYSQRNLALAREKGDKLLEGRAYIGLGWLATLEGDYKEAIRLEERALVLLEAVGDKEGIGNAYFRLSKAYQELRNYPEAEAFSRKELKLFQSMQRKGSEALVLLHLGELAADQRQYAPAIAHYRQALAIVQASDSQNAYLASVLFNKIGAVREREGNLTEARDAFRLAKETDLQNGIATNNFIRVSKLMATNILLENQQEANRYCQVAEQEASTYTLTQCSLAMLQTGELQKALAFVKQALEHSRAPAELAYAHYLEGTVLSALDLAPAAEKALMSALQFKPVRSLRADIYLALGVLKSDPAQFERARTSDPTITQVSSVSDLGGRNRRVRLPVRGEREQDGAFQEAYVPPIYRRLLINGKPVLLLVDTGAAYTLLNEEDCRRTAVKPTADSLLVAYADGRQERLKRYLPDSIKLNAQTPQTLKTPWLLGSTGKDSLLGRDLLRQMMTVRWFKETRGH